MHEFHFETKNLRQIYEVSSWKRESTGEQRTQNDIWQDVSRCVDKRMCSDKLAANNALPRREKQTFNCLTLHRQEKQNFFQNRDEIEQSTRHVKMSEKMHKPRNSSCNANVLPARKTLIQGVSIVSILVLLLCRRLKNWTCYRNDHDWQATKLKPCMRKHFPALRIGLLNHRTPPKKGFE